MLGEIIDTIEVPRPNVTHTLAFEKHVGWDGDFADASVAVDLVWQDDRVIKARTSLGAVAPLPARAKSAERAFAGSRLTDFAVRTAAEMVIAGVLPLSDNGYKFNLIVNLTERTLRKNRDQRA